MVWWMVRSMVLIVVLSSLRAPATAQEEDISGFQDSAHHWYDIADEDKLFLPSPNQPRFNPSEVGKIADNILLYQKSNGGWPKNYDMLAILTPEQKHILDSVKNETNSTFDNGATYSQVDFLARAYHRTGDERYHDASLRGLRFILGAQYPNGGWPQFYPDTSGYRKYITFNDGAMVGIMTVFLHILQNEPQYSFVAQEFKEDVRRSFERGVDCILKCQVVENGVLTVWGQQHDNVDFHPQNARAFEPASLGGRESAEITLLLMSIDKPEKRIVTSVQAAVRWFSRSGISGIRVREFKAPVAHYKYRTTVDYDREVVEDPNAPLIWARLYELGTNKPLFCNRDEKPVYSLAEVERERRAGYSWYGYEPAEVLEKYPSWQKKWSPDENALAD